MNLRIALLLCAAALFLSRTEEVFAPLVFIAVVWLGLIIALRLRPSLRSLVRDRRFPSAREGFALLTGLGGGFVTVIAEALVFTAIEALHQRVEVLGLMTWSFACLWALASVGPLWRELIQSRGGEAREDHGYPGAALFWGVPLGLGLFLTRLTVIDPLTPQLSTDVWLGILAALPSCGLLIIAGLAGTSAARRGVKDSDTEVWIVFTGAASIWALLSALMLVDLAGISIFGIPRVSSASIAAAVYTCAVSAAWTVTLWRLRTMVFRNTVTAVMAGLVLLCSGALSLIAPIAVAGSGEWESLIALVLFPVVAVSVLVILLVVHPALNWLNGERFRPRREPDPSAANLPTSRYRR
jgi:hypothetical protein